MLTMFFFPYFFDIHGPVHPTLIFFGPIRDDVMPGDALVALVGWWYPLQTDQHIAHLFCIHYSYGPLYTSYKY
jgi:hypothetical protein